MSFRVGAGWRMKDLNGRLRRAGEKIDLSPEDASLLLPRDVVISDDGLDDEDEEDIRKMAAEVPLIPEVMEDAELHGKPAADGGIPMSQADGEPNEPDASVEKPKRGRKKGS